MTLITLIIITYFIKMSIQHVHLKNLALMSLGKKMRITDSIFYDRKILDFGKDFIV